MTTSCKTVTKKVTKPKQSKSTKNTKTTTPVDSQDRLAVSMHFPTPIYIIDKPEFLETTRKVSKEFIDKRKKEVEFNEIYPVYMSEALNYDPRMLDFANYVGQTGWNILNEQGYAMNNLSTYFTEMWCQEHHKHSLMEQHVHGYGVQLVGFYFLDMPPGSPSVVFHDPRPGKVQLNLFEKSLEEVTIGSNMINFEVKPGTLIFTNAWLAHSFSRSSAIKPMRFIHFNIGVQDIRTINQNPEII